MNTLTRITSSLSLAVLSCSLPITAMATRGSDTHTLVVGGCAKANPPNAALKTNKKGFTEVCPVELKNPVRMAHRCSNPLNDLDKMVSMIAYKGSCILINRVRAAANFINWQGGGEI